MKVVKLKQMKHPLRELSEADVTRIQAVVNGKLGQKWISFEEMEAYQDLIYDTIAAKIQTHDGSLVLQ